MMTPLIAVLLAGCGGGGGTPGTSSADTTELPEVEVFLIEGQSVTANFVQSSDTGERTVTTQRGPDASGALLTFEDGVLVRAEVSAPGSDLVFDTSLGDEIIIDGASITFISPDREDLLELVNFVEVGFEYQTFGAWDSGFGTDNGSFGAASYGEQTDPASVPSGTTATYSGGSYGTAKLADGELYLTNSNIDVTTDFSTVDIVSSNTQGLHVDNNTSGPLADLDFSGSGPVSGNGFTANIASAISSGTADGVFYGPSANEVGGTFQTSGAGNVSYIGAFGAN